MKHDLKRAASAAVLFLLSTLGFLCGLFDSTDHFMTDNLYTSFRAVHPRIFIIGIDGDSLDRYGPWGSWSRMLAADLINYLNEDPSSKPAVIGMDILFTGNTTDREDSTLLEAVRQGGNVVLASQAVFSKDLVNTESDRSWNYAQIEKYEEPFDALRSAAPCGLMNVFPDTDGFVRRSIYQYDYQGKHLYSLGEEIARAYSRNTGSPQPFVPPLGANGQWRIPFAGKPGDFFGSGSKGTSWVRVMDGEIPRELFADSIVLVGPYTTGMLDSFYTSADRHTPMYGVEIHANIVQSLLEGNFKHQLPALGAIAVVFIISLLLFLAFCRYGVHISTLLTLAVCGGYFFAAVGLYKLGLTLPLFYPLLTFALIYLALLVTNTIMLTVEKASLYDQMHRLFVNSIRTIANAIDAKDPCTSGHCQRVAEYSLMLGRGMHCSADDLADLEYAALLHDVGKIGVSDSVLKKDGPLTDEEYEEMKTHPKRGAQILGEIQEFRGRITDGARYHHERYDGRGYCEGLAGEAIPLFGRIIAIADAFDAMTQNRPYRLRMPQDKAVAELRRNVGTQFDPQLVLLFISLVEECPPPEECAPEKALALK